jgi:hypothetical protein
LQQNRPGADISATSGYLAIGVALFSLAASARQAEVPISTAALQKRRANMAQAAPPVTTSVNEQEAIHKVLSGYYMPLDATLRRHFMANQL